MNASLEPGLVCEFCGHGCFAGASSLRMHQIKNPECRTLFLRKAKAAKIRASEAKVQAQAACREQLQLWEAAAAVPKAGVADLLPGSSSVLRVKRKREGEEKSPPLHGLRRLRSGNEVATRPGKVATKDGKLRP